MPTPFPGMDPYLERLDLWPNVHGSLIVAIRDDLAPRLRPRYYVSVEERTYFLQPDDTILTAQPDVAVLKEAEVTCLSTKEHELPTPITVELPLPDTMTERFLEIQAIDDGRIITVLEILSPTNKRPGRGRAFI